MSMSHAQDVAAEVFTTSGMLGNFYLTRDLQHLATSELVQNFMEGLYQSKYMPQKFLEFAHQFQPSYDAWKF